MPSLRAEAAAALSRLGVRAEKRRGQNFMVDEGTLDAVASALPFEKGEAVVEIGPGLGFLTRKLIARGAYVVAVEKDTVMTRHLRESFPATSLRVLEADVLETDLVRDAVPDRPSKVFGNIPYNITSPILEWLISQRPLVREAALTVQLELAQRLLAKPGTKEWGALSVFLNFYAKVTLVRKIGRGNFQPAPNVDSALVRIVFSETPRVRVDDEAAFFRTVRPAFQKRRKTLLNALESEATGRSKAELAAAFTALRLDGRRRPETLTLEEWAALSDHIAKAGLR
jgi:16S rRNA (adenine1518-N6/adenine1519-N6)-dimethyltransferase